MDQSSSDADPHPAILAALQAIPHSGRIAPTVEAGITSWLFTLPVLYETCCSLDDRVEKLGYRGFRRLLYANSTNLQLSRAGLRFDIAQDKGHVDKNVYRLVATAGKNPDLGSL